MRGKGTSRSHIVIEYNPNARSRLLYYKLLGWEQKGG